MRIDSSAKYNQNFTSVLPTIVRVNGGLCADMAQTEEVMVKMKEILFKKHSPESPQAILKNRFLNYMHELKAKVEIAKKDLTEKDVISIVKPEYSLKRPYVGYFFTDDTVRKLNVLKESRPNEESEILNNRAHIAKSPKDHTTMGLYIKAQKNSAGKLDIYDINFSPISEEAFLDDTCLFKEKITY